MKSLRISFVLFLGTLCALLFAPTAYALDTVPTQPPETASPLLITRYSFQGSQLRAVEIYNNTSAIHHLDGWQVIAETTGIEGQRLVLEIAGGIIEPRTHITIADPAVVTTLTELYLPSSPIEGGGVVSRVILRAPAGLYYADQSYAPPASASNPENVYVFHRSTTASGAYSTAANPFTAGSESGFFDDGLYFPPTHTNLEIVEVYPNSLACPSFQVFEAEPLCHDYIKLYNPTSQEIDLSSFRLRGSSVASLSGVLLSDSFVAVPISLNNSGWVWLEDTYGLVVYESSVVEYPDASGFKGRAWSLGEAGDWRWSSYPTPSNTPNQFSDGRPVNECSGLVINEIGANLERQFIELRNSSGVATQLEGCQLQTNRSAENSFVFPAETLAPGALKAVFISDTTLTLTKTTSGTVYLLSSDGMSEVDARSYENLSKDTSLALVDGVWRQTFRPTPGSSNIYEQFPPCQADYERNVETGRCNKKSSAASALTPCRQGQYRHPETNRCRNIASSASTLTPCRPGQERNPETNRCRSVAVAGASLVPCGPGQERNPETNRCRKVAAISTLDDTLPFPVESTDGDSESFAGWAALGVLAISGVIYGIWEWREEIVGLRGRVLSKLKR